MDVSSHGERSGRTEALFRAVNERIAESAVDGPVTVVCECGDSECIDHVLVPVEEYEDVRGESTRFVVKPGHADGEVEQVVDRRDGYDVVEKTDPDAAEIAEQTDPR